MRIVTANGKQIVKMNKADWEKIGVQSGWAKLSQHLDNVKTLEKLTDRELTRAIRDAIIAEEDAIKQYETVVDSTDNKKAKEVLTSVANEEKIHVFELQKLLNILCPEEKDFKNNGEKEVEDNLE